VVGTTADKPMVWFEKDTLEFLRELQQNNNRKWFEANRPRYEGFVRQPMLRFAAEMIARMREVDPMISMHPEQALFQPSRDTRLSYDKSPYKTHAGLLIARTGPGSFAHPGLYIQLAGNSFGVASGFHALEPAQTFAIRRHIAANPDEFSKHLAQRRFHQLFITIRGETNRLLPPELREAAEKQPLLYNKQFYYWAEHEPERALRGDLPDFIMDHLKACAPMNEFLMGAFCPGSRVAESIA
jgi:uncharacterized protein (TIGR02453 family)